MEKDRNLLNINEDSLNNDNMGDTSNQKDSENYENRDGYGRDSDNHDGTSFDEFNSYQEIKIRKIVREEISRNYHHKKNRLMGFVLIVAGLISGSFGAAALISSGMVKAPLSISETNSPQHVEISLKEDSTVENAVAKKAIPSIVGITSTVETVGNNFFLQGIPSYSEAVGSGVIVDSKGYILTNSHVVSDGNSQSIRVLLSDGEKLDAELLWNDATLDLAMIKVDRTGLTAAEFGDSEKVQVGDKSIAIGNPLGLDLQSTLTSGFISGLERSIQLKGGNIMDGLIQTDAAINSGNSGGALLNAEGKVIGINTARPQSADGIGFAIPINTAKPIIEKIVEEGSYKPLYIGITGYNVQIARQMGLNDLPVRTGVLIKEVVAGSPAAKAGIVPGDIITAIGDDEVSSMNRLKTILLNCQEGDEAKLKVYHGEKQVEKTIIFESFSME